MGTVRVFVYGTLLRGEANDRLLCGAERLEAEARVRGTLFDTGDGYPALTLGEPDADVPPGCVAGEVYAVDEAALAALDELEDYYGPGDERNLYERVETTAATARGELRTLIYVFPPERAAGLRRIAHGDWRRHRSRGEE